MRALLLSILLVIVGLCAFIARRWTDTRTSVPPTPVVVEVEPAPAEPPPPTAVTAPVVRDGAELVAGAEAPAANVPIEDRVQGAFADPEFEARYAEWTQDRLEQKLADLESAFLIEVDHVCDQRFDAGQFRVVDEAEVEGLDDSYDVLAPLDAQGLLTRSRMVARELPGEEAEGEIEGSYEYQIVSLPPDAYPELYRKVRELEWLRARTADEAPR